MGTAVTLSAEDSHAGECLGGGGIGGHSGNIFGFFNGLTFLSLKGWFNFD